MSITNTTSAASASMAKLARDARGIATDLRGALQRQFRQNYFSHREVEIIAVDAKGERLGDPDFLPIAALNGKSLRSAVESLRKDYPSAASFAVQGGIDQWESFNEYMRRGEGFDYEPLVATWEVPLSGAQ